MNFRCVSKESEGMFPFLDWGKLLCAALGIKYLRCPCCSFHLITSTQACYSNSFLFKIVCSIANALTLYIIYTGERMFKNRERDWEDSTATDNYFPITSWGCKVPIHRRTSVWLQFHPLWSLSSSFIATTQTLLRLWFQRLAHFNNKKVDLSRFICYSICIWSSNHFTLQFPSSCKFLLQ